MKTSLMLLASLALGTAAIAQDAKQQTETAPSSNGSPTPDAAAGVQPGAPTNGADQSMGTAPMTPAPATAPMTPAPDASAMPAPATTSTPDASAMAPSTDTSSYPVCSRTVTDKCVQKGAMKKMHHK